MAGMHLYFISRDILLLQCLAHPCRRKVVPAFAQTSGSR